MPSAIQAADFGEYGVGLARIFARVVNQATDRLAHIGQAVRPDDLLEKLDLARFKLNRVWPAVFHGNHLRVLLFAIDEGFEADFIIDDHTAIEVKAKQNVSATDIKSLRAIAEEGTFKRLLCVSLESRPRQLAGITFLPLPDFLDALWG